MNKSTKGNRAEQELCRKLREFGFTVTKARMSKGPWDRIAEGGQCRLRSGERLFGWMAEIPNNVTILCIPQTDLVAQGRWYFDITSNSPRGRIKKLVETDGKPGVKVLAVRYDGKGRKPARWRFWIA